MSRIIWLNKTDSSNSEVRRRFPQLDNLSVIATKKQTDGRGQGDHVWYSSPGKNLTFSIALKFGRTLLSGDGILITCATTLAIRDYLLSKGVNARVKWPNDIWVDDRKICGILIENTVEGVHVSGSIVGVGLNINETTWPPELPNPISLSQITGKRYCIRKAMRQLHKTIRRRYSMMSSDDGRQKLQEEFEKVVFRLN